MTDTHGRQLLLNHTYYSTFGWILTELVDPDGHVYAYKYQGLNDYSGVPYVFKKVIFQDDEPDAPGSYDVTFLSHLDGPDGSTQATDESAGAHSLTFVGAAQLATDQSRFGTASARFNDSSTSYISTPDSDDWNFGAGQFTVEAWVQFASAGDWANLVMQYDDAATQIGWALQWIPSGISFVYSPDGSWANRVRLVGSWTPTLGVWYHIAVDRDQHDRLRVYVDGVPLIVLTVPTAFHDSIEPVRIGRGHDGWIDDVRITKGAALYAGTFYPSAQPLDTSPDAHLNNPSVEYLYEDPLFSYGITGIVDENGDRIATFAYDSEGRATLSEHADGAGRYEFSNYTFNSTTKDRTTTIKGPLGKEYLYSFEEIASDPKLVQIDRIASASTPAATATLGYDANGFLASKTDWNGGQTNYTHSSRGLQTSRTEAVGTPEERTITTSWDPNFRVPTQIIAPGLTTDFTYNTSGLLTQVTGTDTTGHSVPYSTNGETRTTSFTYNASGLLWTVDGPLPGTVDVTTFGYDASGNVQSVTNALGHVTQITAHDASGRPLSALDANGVQTDFVYDLRGRVTTITSDVAGTPHTSTITYDAAGRVISTTTPAGDVLTYEYDGAYRLTAIENADGERIEYAYDAMGNRTSTEVRASGGGIVRQASATFDDMGRLLKSLGAYVGEETAYAYDANGNVVSVTDPLSNTTGHAFDALNRLVSTTDAAMGVADMEWDSSDNLESATDQRGLSTAMVYNGFGNVIQYASPDSGTEVYEYDSAGNMIRRTDARGVVTEWTYDELGRPTVISFPATPAENVTYSYDDPTTGYFGIGRPATVTDESGSTAYRYDAHGNIVRVDRTIGAQLYVTEYAWNADDLLVGKTYPSGRIVTYVRNTRGQVTSITTQADAGAAAVPVASAIAYEPFGPVNALTYGNAATLNLSFDLDGQLQAMDAYDGGTAVLDLDYGYDLAGNITSIADAGGGSRGRNYAYDALHRLNQAQELAPGGSSVDLQTDYAYDAVGNRTERVVVEGNNQPVTDTLTYDPFSNRLTSVSTYTPRNKGTPPSTVMRGFTYSDSGNVTLDDAGGTAMTLTYNSADRLVQVSMGAIPLVDYVYAATGQRAVKQTPAATTHFLYDPGGALYAETDGAGNVLREYITLGGATVAIVDAGGMVFVHSDHLGAPQVMTDGSAAVVWDASYRPFGEATITGFAANDQRFPGQYADAETGYYDNWHRTYDPRLGRYLQSDPIGILAGFNTYAYAGGNPVMYADPTGENFTLAIRTCMPLIVADGLIPIGDIACAGLLAAAFYHYAMSESGCLPMTSPNGWGDDDDGSFPRNHNNPSEPPLPKDPKDPLQAPPPPPIWDSTSSPALEDSPYHPDVVEGRVRPPYKKNDAHDPRSPNFNPRKTPEPTDAEDVYRSSIRGDMGTWWGYGSDGKIYRYFYDNAGTVHFSGSFSPNNLPRNAPKEFRK